jgi:VWFA-related protein
LLLAPVVTPAQQEPSFSSNVEVVNVIATVRDKSGKLITNLEKDDFVLKEDGKKQTIQYFARQTDLPLTIGLLVDTSLSQTRVLEQQRTASYRFLDRVLKEKDQAFVIRFDREVELVQDLTNSKELLQAALAKLKTLEEPRMHRRLISNSQFPGGSPFPGGRRRGPFPGGGGPGGPPRGPGGMGVGTALYDAVFLAADEMLKDQAGRKALILVSDGVDVGSKVSEDESVEAVQRQDGILYSVYFSDREGFRGRFGGIGRMRDLPDGDKVLLEMSEQTGGSMYELSSDLTLDQVFDRIEEELRSQYSIGYTPPANPSKEFRKIELKAKKGGLEISTRAGYYPASK